MPVLLKLILIQICNAGVCLSNLTNYVAGCRVRYAVYRNTEGEEGEEDISDWKLCLGFLSETRD